MGGHATSGGRGVADVDMALVARIVGRAGVRCVLEEPVPGMPTILAEPRGRAGWAVRATLSAHREHAYLAWVGPNDGDGDGDGGGDGGAALCVPEPDERHLAALIVAQSLRADPAQALTVDEIDALGLGRRSLSAPSPRMQPARRARPAVRGGSPSGAARRGAGR
jgi:hypothetical protein